MIKTLIYPLCLHSSLIIITNCLRKPILSYVNQAGLNHTNDIVEARRLARLSVADCLDLCDISKRTWYRWLSESPPKWAVRLILSQVATLDRFGWRGWEIRGGKLYFNQLSYQYFWEPCHLVLPLYGIKNPTLLKPQTDDDNMSNVVVLHPRVLVG